MDAGEFEKVFWDLYPRLLGYARHQLDHAGADDVVSETMATLWGKALPLPATEEQERGLRALAFQVLAGHIRNEHRSRRRRRALGDRLLAQPGDGVAGGVTTDHVDAADSLDRWLAGLSADDREVILLFHAGLDVAESATVLGCSRAAAGKRRTRARERLRAIIEREEARP